MLVAAGVLAVLCWHYKRSSNLRAYHLLLCSHCLHGDTTNRSSILRSFHTATAQRAQFGSSFLCINSWSSIVLNSNLAFGKLIFSPTLREYGIRIVNTFLPLDGHVHPITHLEGNEIHSLAFTDAIKDVNKSGMYPTVIPPFWKHFYQHT